MKAAQALAKRLGEGWSANIFENMGWHFQVAKGVCAISKSKHGRKTVYTVYFNSARQFVVTAGTPEQALSTMRSYANAHMKKIIHDLKGMPL